MQNKDNHSQQRRPHHHRDSYPRNPLSRSQEKLPFPRFIFICGREYDDLGIWNDPFHVDVVFFGVDRGTDEQILDIIVCSPEAEERVWRLQWMIWCLRKLTDYNSHDNESTKRETNMNNYLVLQSDDQKYRGRCTCMKHRNSSRRTALVPPWLVEHEGWILWWLTW